ncbi:MAG: efflux RND transporter periplasmic adaptor subunit [Candidatus Scalinduaceae bacterium]
MFKNKIFTPPVVVSRIIQMDVKQPVKMVGTVFPFRESIVAGEIDGLVVEFPVKRGDYVKYGQVLAKLKTKTLEIELKGAEAELGEKRASIGEAEASEHLALIEYQRAKELHESGTISSSEFDEFETKYDQAREGHKKEKASLAVQEAEVEKIQEDINKCTILAPFDGRITEEYIEVGQWIDQGDRVVSMIEMDYVKVRVPVPEKYIQKFKVGDECKVSLSALDGMMRKGNIIHIVPQANSRGRTFPVYIKLDNKDEMIKSGMFAEATFEIGPLLTATMILKDAVVRRGGKAIIYLAVDGKAVEVPVRTGVSHENLIQVIGDVKPGLDVIVRGNERLRNTQKIKVTGRLDPDIQLDSTKKPLWTQMKGQKTKGEERRGMREEGGWMKDEMREIGDEK